MQTFNRSLHLLDARSPYCVQIACFMKCKLPPNFDHVALPERRKLQYIEKIPQPISPSVATIKMPKMTERMRGPEAHHNRIIYGEFGIQALEGGQLKFGHLESLRMQVIRKMDDKKCFAIYRIDPLWQSISRRPVGHRGGGGKTAVKYYVTPVKPGRIIMEIGGFCVLDEVKPMLKTMTGFLPFKARIVSRELLESEKGKDEELERLNQNPFTYEYCAKNNVAGIQKWLSPYDYDFLGKYK